ncbi:hypothetical protein BDR06DRAFT_1005328 [Suillus hirtellus]|nr:hypothetical protein BDR06DRAFT_1005328 [Suillus hirtellus]
MQWANYWNNIVQHYRVICEGWPAHIPLKNLSKASTSLPELQMLHDILLDEDKYQRLLQERNEKISTREIIESSHRPCSDKGKKHVQPMEEPSILHRKKVYKSLDTIESSDKEVNAPHTGTSVPSPSVPLPSSVPPSVSTSAPWPLPSSVQPSMSTLAPSPLPPSAQPSMSTLAPLSLSLSASASAPSTSTASAST